MGVPPHQRLGYPPGVNWQTNWKYCLSHPSDADEFNESWQSQKLTDLITSGSTYLATDTLPVIVIDNISIYWFWSDIYCHYLESNGIFSFTTALRNIYICCVFWISSWFTEFNESYLKLIVWNQWGLHSQITFNFSPVNQNSHFLESHLRFVLSIAQEVQPCGLAMQMIKNNNYIFTLVTYRIIWHVESYLGLQSDDNCEISDTHLEICSSCTKYLEAAVLNSRKISLSSCPSQEHLLRPVHTERNRERIPKTSLLFVAYFFIIFYCSFYPLRFCLVWTDPNGVNKV